MAIAGNKSKRGRERNQESVVTVMKTASSDASKSYVRTWKRSWPRDATTMRPRSTWGRILRNGREFIANCWSTFKERERKLWVGEYSVGS